MREVSQRRVLRSKQVYVQLTEDCNMQCECCNLSAPAASQSSVFMTQETFLSVIQLFLQEGFTEVIISGGEPSIHPSFIDFVTIAIASSLEKVIVQTNGKAVAAMQSLAAVSSPKLAVFIARDRFHEDIDAEVLELFSGRTFTFPYMLNAGRAAEEGRDLDCADWHIFVKPNGNICRCGCSDAPVWGNVNNFSGDLEVEDECPRFEQTNRRIFEYLHRR